MNSHEVRQHLSATTHGKCWDFFNVINKMPTGLPLADAERCELWLQGAVALEYGFNVRDMSYRLKSAIWKCVEALVHEYDADKCEDIRFLDRTTLFFIHQRATNVDEDIDASTNNVVDSTYCFHIRMSYLGQDFLKLDYEDKVKLQRIAHQFNANSLPPAISPLDSERDIWVETNNGALFSNFKIKGVSIRINEDEEEDDMESNE